MEHIIQLDGHDYFMVHRNRSFSAVLKDLQSASKHPQLELQPPSFVHQLPKQNI